MIYPFSNFNSLILYWASDYSSILGLKWNHFDKEVLVDAKIISVVDLKSYNLLKYFVIPHIRQKII